MRWTPKLLAAAGVVTVGFIVGNLSGRLAGARYRPLAEPSAPHVTQVAAIAAARPAPLPAPHAQRQPVQTVEALAEPVASPAVTQPADWQDQLDAILRADLDTADKVRQLLNLYPSLSEESQIEAAAHIANLLPDKDYPALGRYLTDTNTPAGVLDILMADLRHRPDSLKLPLLLEVARTPNHPKSGEAKDLLATHLDHDYGADWDLWSDKITQSVRNSADIIPFD